MDVNVSLKKDVTSEKKRLQEVERGERKCLIAPAYTLYFPFLSFRACLPELRQL